MFKYISYNRKKKKKHIFDDQTRQSYIKSENFRSVAYISDRNTVKFLKIEIQHRERI